MSTLNVDKVDPSTGTALELGTSGDTITVPTGAGLTVVDEVKTNKVSPATGTAFALGDSGDTFTVPSGATIVNSGTATGFGITSASFLPTANPLIINGDMAVSQRSTSVAGITSAGYNTLDRWLLGNTNGGTWTQSQEALTADEAYEDGFSTALKMDCTTADASLGAADNLILQQRIEGQDLQLLKFGSSTSATLTLGFWVKSTKTGTCIAELYQTDDTRSCSQSYTIDTTNTWEYKVLNYPVDTTGVIDNNNDTGLTVLFWMAAGTNFTSGSLNTTWGTATTANRAVGQVNCADSTSNNFHITGVQLEVGTYTSSTIPPFRHESHQENLWRCERYYREIVTCTGVAPNTTTIQWMVHLASMSAGPMRVAPSVTCTSISTTDMAYADHNDASVVSTAQSLYATGGRISTSGMSGLTTGRVQLKTYNASYQDIQLDAEL